MFIYWRALSVPKAGNKDCENDDAFAPNITEKNFTLKKRFSCAISDGATETAFSRLWAKTITQLSRKQHCIPSIEKLELILDTALKVWDKEVKSKPLPWFAEEKLKKGSFATLIWLTICGKKNEQDPSGEWRAIAIGDSNLFQIRGNQILHKFPINSSNEFGNAPILLSTNKQLFKASSKHIHQNVGNWQSGDSFFMMTDALAFWFLKELERLDKEEQDQTKVKNYQNIIDLLEEISTYEKFISWVNDKRSNREMRNDDTTLIRIKLESN